MKNAFVLDDIRRMLIAIGNSSASNDCLPNFLNSFTFESVYETDDDSLVFYASGKNKLEIEFFNFNFPYSRTCSIMYYENGKPVILYWDELKKLM